MVKCPSCHANVITRIKHVKKERGNLNAVFLSLIGFVVFINFGSQFLAKDIVSFLDESRQAHVRLD